MTFPPLKYSYFRGGGAGTAAVALAGDAFGAILSSTMVS